MKTVHVTTDSPDPGTSDEPVAPVSADLSELFLFGLNHRGAAVALRERFARASADQPKLISHLLRVPGIREIVIESTCNRFELVAAVSREFQADFTEERLLREIAVPIGEIRPDERRSFYALSGAEVARHVFKVAAGLDSMVLGEPQILGQLKSAYRLAQTHSATGPLLNRLYPRAFHVAKEVRSRTRIGCRAISVPYAAFELARQIFDNLQESSVMLIGAGEMGALTLKYFASAGVNKLFVVNRTLERALSLASATGAIPASLSQLETIMDQADIVIGCVSMGHDQQAVVTKTMMREVMRRRSHRAQFFIDLGVPRNFDSSLAELSSVFLYDIDDLEQVIRENVDARKLEALRAEAIVEEETRKFSRWLASRDLHATIAGLMQKVDQMKLLELQKTMRRLLRAGLSAEQYDLVKDAVEHLCDGLVGRMLHQPISVTKSRSVTDSEALKNFYELLL